MLSNAYFLAKIGADTAENEQHFAEILPKIGNYPTGPPLFSCASGRACEEPEAPVAPSAERRGEPLRVRVAAGVLDERPAHLGLGCKKGCGLNLNFELI